MLGMLIAHVAEFWHLTRESQRFFMKNTEIQNLSEGANGGLGAKPPAAGGKGVWGQSTQRPAIFNENKAFLDLNFSFITILCREQAEDEAELFRLDHDKLHNPFQSFISAAASLEKWNRQLSDNRLLIYFS